jgi:hypothetical protein
MVGRGGEGQIWGVDKGESGLTPPPEVDALKAALKKEVDGSRC